MLPPDSGEPLRFEHPQSPGVSEVLAQQLDQRRIDVDLADDVFGLGFELLTVPD
jgi:hypothetical protein